MIFDWCKHGPCEGCPGTVPHFWIDPETNEPVFEGVDACDHTCHQEISDAE